MEEKSATESSPGAFLPGRQARGFASSLETRHLKESERSSIPLEDTMSQASSAGRIDEELEESQESTAMDLREAIRSKVLANLERALKRPGSRLELMAKNSTNGAGLLMLAAATGEARMLHRVAAIIKKRLGMPRLAKQLRYVDDDDEPLMFYAAKSSPTMFEVVEGLVRDTIGEVGLVEQLRHRSAKRGNILMEACVDQRTFEKVWILLEQADCLEEQKAETDSNGKSWIHYAAEAGNLTAMSKFGSDLSAKQESLSVADNKGWTGFMYAARGRGDFNASFLEIICGRTASVVDPGNGQQIKEQMTRVARDSDKSMLLMHAAIGGRKSYEIICSLMAETGCVDENSKYDQDVMLLSWAAKGGDTQVFEIVAQGIKTKHFPDTHNPERPWNICSTNDESDNLLNAVRLCTERPGHSLFLSTVESDNSTMISEVGEGIVSLFTDPEDCWRMLCGNGGNPLSVAAGKSVQTFRVTLGVLTDVSRRLEPREQPELRVIALLWPEEGSTPLCNAVFSEKPFLFNEVLTSANVRKSQTLQSKPISGSMIIRQVQRAMTPLDESGQPSEEHIISAKMLAMVLKAAKEADKGSGGFQVTDLDSFMERAVSRGAFDHIRELLRIGCDLENHFSSVLNRIGEDEIDTSECMILAITTASNPFRECGIASQAIYQAMLRRSRDYAALDSLQQKIGDLTLELLDHLPHSVGSVGEELSRGDPNFQPFMREPVGKVDPKILLGFLVVGWMLEGWGHSSPDVGDSGLLGGENSLVQAERSGPRALDFFSEPLVLDYLSLKFSRTLPDWDTQKPFERNIYQSFYSYTQQARKLEHDTSRPDHGKFQYLFLFLQGWNIDQNIPRQRTVLPSLQFILAGVIGNPVPYYAVPMIRMAFIVINYIATIGLYLSCMSLQSGRIPWNEWLFYVVMLGVVWREALEFSNAQKLEPAVGASIQRYFGDKWNFLDVITMGVVFVAFVFRMMELIDGSAINLFLAQVFLASAAPFLFSRVLFLSQAGSTLGPMTQVIFNMVIQLSQFSLILLLVMLGFAATFNALYAEDTALVHQDSDNCDVNDHPVVEAFGTIGDALLTMFSFMLGEFDFGIFSAHYQNRDGEDCGGVAYQSAGISLTVIYLVIMSVTLLNFLIAVLSTVHSSVQQNAQKEFQVVRARVILQSAEDVKNDALPPPFNLLKPILGIFWIVVSIRSERWYHRWEVVTGTLHRIIFAFVVGLVALATLTILWIVSLPMQTWKLSLWLSEKATTSPKKNEGGQNNGENNGILSKERRRSTGRRPFANDETEESEEQVFFVGTNDRWGPRSQMLLRSTLVQVVRMPFVVLLAVFLCFFVYPVLNVVLWMRGLVNVWQYAKAIQRTKNPWKRRQIHLGEEEEWSMARTHAIKMNRRFRTANSSDLEFNVNALLKTTTGMTMEDLRQNMATLKSSRRQRALGASIDAVVSQFLPDDDSLDQEIPEPKTSRRKAVKSQVSTARQNERTDVIRGFDFARWTRKPHREARLPGTS